MKPNYVIQPIHTQGVFEINRARDALMSVPPDLNHDDWHRVGCAAIAAGLTVNDVDRWSAQAEGIVRNGKKLYPGTKGVLAAFKGIEPTGGASAKTLYWYAHQHGGKFEADTQRPAQARPTPKPAEPSRQPDPSIAEVWNRLQPATAQHPYALRKQLCREVITKLRVVAADDPLTAYRGWLAVPGYNADGALTMIEFVAADGKKRSMNGSVKSGSMFTAGPAAGPAVVLEGLGAADAVFASTGSRCIGAFGAGNIRAVVEALHQKEPDTPICIGPDRGKEQDAFKIAAEFGCSVACLPESEPHNFDLNDLFVRDGFDAVQQVLESATVLPKPEPLLKPVSVTDLFTRPSPPPAFAWESYCPLDEVTLFAANGGTGKSVIGQMLSVSGSLGRPLFGVPTKPGRVLFVSLEDGAEIVRHRLASICRAWGIDPAQLDGRLTVVDGTDCPELFSVEGRAAGDVTSSYAELRDLAKGATLVVIDNASDAFGGDEIKRREVRAFVRVLKRIAKAEHCAVVLLAHVNAMTARARKPTDDEGYSGSTAWNNSVRSRLFLSRDELGLLTLAHQKANLSKRREPITLQWLDDGLPELAQSGADGSRQQGRADDNQAVALLKMLAEFEALEQFASPSPTARNNVHNLLKSEPAFINLKLRPDDTKRIVNQCQRAKWIEPMDYRSKHTNKNCQRWTLSPKGREFAGLPTVAPTAPTAPTCNFGNEGAEGACGVHPQHPHMQGGTGGIAHTDVGALSGAETVSETTPPTETQPTTTQEDF